jgi:hypothetical protein
MSNVTVRQEVGLKGQKHIRLSESTYDRLRRYGKFDESIYGLLNMLLDDIEGKPVTKTKK